MEVTNTDIEKYLVKLKKLTLFIDYEDDSAIHKLDKMIHKVHNGDVNKLLKEGEIIEEKV